MRVRQYLPIFVACFVFLLFMGIHNHHLKMYSKYEEKSFKNKYYYSYKHIFETAMQRFPDTLSSSVTPTYAINEPNWAVRFKENELESIFMSLLVLSAPNHFEKRNQMRIDFNNFLNSMNISGNFMLKKELAKITFVIGDSQNYSTETHLNNEHKIHGDILRLAVKDSYKNLSFKTLSYFDWVIKLLRARNENTVFKKDVNDDFESVHNDIIYQNKNTCTKRTIQKENKHDYITWIVKVDDDVTVNYRDLVVALKTEKQERDLYGRGKLAILCSTVLRNNGAEWRNDSMTRKWLVVTLLRMLFLTCRNFIHQFVNV